MDSPRPATSNNSLPVAGGTVICARVADQAAEWLTLLMSGEASEQELQAWQHWRAAHRDHERAWQHIEAITGRIKRLESSAAYRSLSQLQAPPSMKRRKAMEALALGGIACITGLTLSSTNGFQSLVADFRTGTGAQRVFTLDDGTRLTLNTATSVEPEFTPGLRLLRLVAGEILVETAHAIHGQRKDSRPFIVQTAQGRIRALGTRFVVRQQQDHTQVQVLESAVEITPDHGSGHALRLQAGEQASFTGDQVGAAKNLDEQQITWVRGQLMADNQRLADFLLELDRYRPGVLRCDPAVADLRLSGVFPLQNTDRILASLPQVLPVHIKSRTRYWVSVIAPE